MWRNEKYSDNQDDQQYSRAVQKHPNHSHKSDWYICSRERAAIPAVHPQTRVMSEWLPKLSIWLLDRNQKSRNTWWVWLWLKWQRFIIFQSSCGCIAWKRKISGSYRNLYALCGYCQSCFQRWTRRYRDEDSLALIWSQIAEFKTTAHKTFSAYQPSGLLTQNWHGLDHLCKALR